MNTEEIFFILSVLLITYLSIQGISWLLGFGVDERWETYEDYVAKEIKRARRAK